MDREKILKTIKISLTGILIIAIIILIVFQTRKIAVGPEIRLDYPKDGETLFTRSILISGNIENAVETKINNRPFYIEENGDFKEIYILSDGLNRIKIYGKDRLGKEISTVLTVIYSGISTDFKTKNAGSTTSNNISVTTLNIASTSTSSKALKDVATSSKNASTTSQIRDKKL